MTDTITPLVIAFKTVTLLVGGLVTVLAVKAARGTHTRGLWYLAAGFGVITAGALLAGVLDQLAAVGPSASLAIESGLTAAGFCVIAYSLYLTSS